MDYENISILANVFVAIGTLILAFVTYLMAKGIKQQIKLLSVQTKVLKKEHNPFLQVRNVKVADNRIILTLKNSGNGDAYSIGVDAKFYPAKIHVEEYDKDKKTTKVSFSYNPMKILDVGEQNLIIVKNGYVNFLKREGLQNNILKAGEEFDFECEPQFYNEYYGSPFEAIARQTASGRILKFDELIGIMKANSCEFFGLDFSVICKNNYEDVMESTILTKFVFDVKTHKNLEAAHKSNYSSNFTALGYRELEMKLNGIPSESYRNMKSQSSPEVEDLKE